MKMLGQYDTDGNYLPFTEPQEVVQFGDTLRDKDTGFVEAVKDDYGDWVNPRMRALGLKVKIKPVSHLRSHTDPPSP